MAQTAPKAAQDHTPAPQGEEVFGVRSENWDQVLGLPCDLSIDAPIKQFTVKDFLGLRVGMVVSSRLTAGSSVPLRVNGALIAWCDFEALGKRLSVRLTELA